MSSLQQRTGSARGHDRGTRRRQAHRARYAWQALSIARCFEFDHPSVPSDAFHRSLEHVLESGESRGRVMAAIRLARRPREFAWQYSGGDPRRGRESRRRRGVRWVFGRAPGPASSCSAPGGEVSDLEDELPTWLSDSTSIGSNPRSGPEPKRRHAERNPCPDAGSHPVHIRKLPSERIRHAGCRREGAGWYCARDTAAVLEEHAHGE